MSTPDSGKPSLDAQRLEDFIFVRELNEVFLLLDHISGCWDKSWYAQPKTFADEIIPNVLELCKIGLEADGSDNSKAEQAYKLLCAKDKLNAAARPASGMTIAFTLLVVGEGNRRSWSAWMTGIGNLWRHWTRPREATLALPPPDAGASAPQAVDAGTVASNGGAAVPVGNALVALPVQRNSSRSWDKPTRLTLARHAFPGLVHVAIKFKLWLSCIVLLLVLGLMGTCVMSWHITGGNVILQHLDELKVKEAVLQKTIAEAELKFATDEQEHQTGQPAPMPMAIPARADAPGQARARNASRPVQFCSLFEKDATPFYRSTEEYQLCSRKRAIERQIVIAHDALGDWLQPWIDVYQYVQAKLSSGRMFYPPPAAQGNTEELAQIVTMVVGTAVLPLFYGVLGAGAAVVRDLWAKMRESLLSPRDLSLALLQLALGATIGACIALFISPSPQAGGKEAALLGSWALSSSALSFVAGFGVEGVFLALESLVRRVFNVSDPARKP
ncbi:hypothetical protein [Pseudoduganella violacea]|uniref:Transmembrane protein n=1 Tax=Pseudoduganella violacea TaxID=1715466 RepID=A0A7W5FVW0_9BURK|nr:hypothetical protein [Pseudoduganella violacea]MBB3121176.1 hypothetical protein [Pseudoduganella violacea]